MAEPGASDTRPNLPSIDEILQDLRCTYKEFRCMKGRHSGFGYYKFCPVVESLIRQTIEVAVQVQGHRAVIDDLYEERKWLVAAYKEEAVSNVRVENAYVELQQRLMLLEQIHKPDRGVLAVQIGRGLVHCGNTEAVQTAAVTTDLEGLSASVVELEEKCMHFVGPKGQRSVRERHATCDMRHLEGNA
ncbi:hypothetical protein ACMFMG_009370 [Clarireedia jacksonii]